MGPEKNLLLLTDFYPFEPIEPFIHNEIPYLVNEFKSVHIFSLYAIKNISSCELPGNVVYHHLPVKLTSEQKFRSLKFLRGNEFWKELLFTRKNYSLKLSSRLVRSMLSTLQSAESYAVALKNYIENRQDDAQWVCYSYWCDFRALALVQLKKKLPLISVSRAHNWEVYFERHDPPYLPFRKSIHDGMDAVFFVSEDGRNYSLKKIPGTGEEKFRVSHLGVPFHGRNGGDAEIFTVVSCSRMVAVKRIPLIADILSHLTMPLKWIHIGAGKESDAILRQIHAKLFKCGNIIFEHRGFMNHDDILDFYAKNHIDLFILTSEFEGIPVAIMEAMAAGIPVMATDAGGIREIVNDKNGFLLNKNFMPQEAAAIIQKFYPSTEEAKKHMRNQALYTWQQHFNANINYPVFLHELSKLR